MDRINILDRNLEEIEEFDDSINRSVVEVIKLTKDSYNAIASESDKNIQSTQIEQDTVEEIKDETSNFDLFSINYDSVNKAFNVNAKAIKETEHMIENSDNKYSNVMPKIDVEEVDKEKIEKTVESSFDFYNINQDSINAENEVTDMELEQNNDEKYDDISIYDEAEFEDSKLDDLVGTNEQAEEDNTDKEEVNLNSSLDNNHINKNIIPEIQNYFSNYELDGAINNSFDSLPEENYSENTTRDLFDEISSSIENEDITASELSKLSQKLSMIFSKNKQLENANEELNREKEAAVDELNNVMEQQHAAEVRKTEIKEKFDMYVNNLEQMNEKLEENTSKVKEEINEVKAKTEKIKSDVTATERYSSNIIEMLSDYGYGVDNTYSSQNGKGKAA